MAYPTAMSPAGSGRRAGRTHILAKKCRFEDGFRPTWSGLAQPVKHARRGKSIRDEADRSLIVADRDPRARTEPSVRVADVETMVGQKLLQLQTLIERQHALVARPIVHKRRTTTH